MNSVEPSNPLGMTYGDMLASAAFEAGDADFDHHGKPVLPANDHEARHAASLVVARAVRRVVRGYEWSWLKQTIAVAIGPDPTPLQVTGEAWRYRMPWSMVSPNVDHIGYREQYDRIELADERVVLEARGVGEGETGIPCLAAIRAAHRRNDRSYQGCELILYPTPSEARTLEIQYRAYPEGMSDKSDTFIAGPEYNHLLDAAIRYEAKFAIRDPIAEKYKAEFDEAMALAKELNRRSRPSVLGVASSTMPSEYDGGLTSRATTVTINGNIL